MAPDRLRWTQSRGKEPPQTPPQVVSPQGFFRCQIPEVARSCQNTLSRLPTSVIRVPHRCPRQRLGFSCFGRLSQYLILMGSFIASPPIERRHTRQRIAEKPSRQVARLELGAAIAISQRQRARPNARREHELSGLAAASRFVEDFSHCNFPRTASPLPQPYRTPVHWPNGDGRLSELGPNMGDCYGERLGAAGRGDADSAGDSV